MKYEVRPSRQAEKELERLDRTTLKRIQTRIDELADNPLNPRLSKRLEMDPEKRYSRIGTGASSLQLTRLSKSWR